MMCKEITQLNKEKTKNHNFKKVGYAGQNKKQVLLQGRQSQQAYEKIFIMTCHKLGQGYRVSYPLVRI